jgi:hypothetical protein
MWKLMLGKKGWGGEGEFWANLFLVQFWLNFVFSKAKFTKKKIDFTRIRKNTPASPNFV